MTADEARAEGFRPWPELSPAEQNEVMAQEGPTMRGPELRATWYRRDPADGWVFLASYVGRRR